MPARPPERDRLADRMEARRLELGLKWDQVAEAGGISYEALRAARNGAAGISRLSRAAIDKGLRWEPGSVNRILDGADPEPLPGAGGTRAAVPELPGDEALIARVLAADPDDQETLRQIMRMRDPARRRALLEAWLDDAPGPDSPPAVIRDRQRETG